MCSNYTFSCKFRVPRGYLVYSVALLFGKPQLMGDIGICPVTECMYPHGLLSSILENSFFSLSYSCLRELFVVVYVCKVVNCSYYEFGNKPQL